MIPAAFGTLEPDVDARVTNAAMTEATDPIRGMVVDIASAKYRSESSGQTVYFCCLHCKETFDRAQTSV
jgi:YHS domain-containing protein